MEDGEEWSRTTPSEVVGDLLQQGAPPSRTMLLVYSTPFLCECWYI